MPKIDEETTTEEPIELSVPSQEPAEAPESPQEGENAPQEAESHEEAPDAPQEAESHEEKDTFPRSYVEELRAEAAENRVKAKRVDELEARLFTYQVEATGLLQDASDLPYSPDLLDDSEALQGAIQDLLSRKPHLASRMPFGDIGQGDKAAADDFSLLGMLRDNA